MALRTLSGSARLVDSESSPAGADFAAAPRIFFLITNYPHPPVGHKGDHWDYPPAARLISCERARRWCAKTWGLSNSAPLQLLYARRRVKGLGAIARPGIAVLRLKAGARRHLIPRLAGRRPRVYYLLMRQQRPMRIILAQPRGFCAGVVRAINIVEKSLEVFDTPVYVRHEIVHNRHVVDGLRSKKAMFVEELEEVPDDATVIFSAHGVSKELWSEAKRRGLNTIDATCPLVTKVHRQAHRLERLGYEILLIGHAGHPEVEGTMGQLPGKIRLIQTAEEAERVEVWQPERVAYLTQTTLSLNDTEEIVGVLRRRFPALQSPPTDDICYATQNRQAAVKRLAELAGLIIVIGAANSSNSNRLVEVATSLGVSAYLVESAAELRDDWFRNVETAAITAGASAPEYLVQEVIDHIQERYGGEVQGDLEGIDEDVHFPLPKQLTEVPTPEKANP